MVDTLEKEQEINKLIKDLDLKFECLDKDLNYVKSVKTIEKAIEYLNIGRLHYTKIENKNKRDKSILINEIGYSHHSITSGLLDLDELLDMLNRYQLKENFRKKVETLKEEKKRTI